MHAGNVVGAAAPDGHRFTPHLRNARAENLTVGVVAAVLGYLLLSARGAERGEAAAVAVLVGILAYGLYALRIRIKGLQAVEVTPDALRVAGKGGTRVLPWEALVRAQHSYYGGDRWAFRTRGGEALQLVLDGYTREEAARINALIREHLPEGVG